MTNLFYDQMKPNEQKICFKGIAHFFLDSYLKFRNFDLFFEVLLKFYNLMAETCWLKVQ